MLLDNIGEITWNTHFADVYNNARALQLHIYDEMCLISILPRDTQCNIIILKYPRYITRRRKVE